MYSHEELISAVRAAGRDGKTFTAKDLRAQLGFETRDKKEISRFRRRLRAFEKAAAAELEKVGNHSYRLRTGAFEQNAALDITPPPAAAELDLEPASGVFEAVAPANQTGHNVSVQPEPTASEHSAAQPTSPPSAAQPTQTSLAAPEQPAEAQRAHTAEQPAEAQRAHTAEQPAEAQRAQAAVQAAESSAAPATVEAARTAAAARAAPAGAAHAVAGFAQQPFVQPPAQPSAAKTGQPSAQATAPRHSGAPQRALGIASALVTNALATSAAFSGKILERGRNLRERGLNLRERGRDLRAQLWSCLESVPLNRHAVARLRGWAEGLKPLSKEVLGHLHTLRQRVSSIRRRAA